MGLKRWIEVSFQREGIHKYPAALDDPRLNDVRYLGFPHRHIFHFYVKIEVFHDDRDIEFILFKKWLENLYADSLTLDYQSCEMIADNLIKAIRILHSDRDITVRVYEDDENGAIIDYTK